MALRACLWSERWYPDTFVFAVVTLAAVARLPRSGRGAVTLVAVARSVPGVAGVLLLFPVYGGIAAILARASSAGGISLATGLSHAFAHLTTRNTYALVFGSYSAFLGMFIPSAGGKWIVEAPYVMQSANALHYPLGWAVQI